MCLGIPAQLVAGETGHPDLARVDMGGVTRVINMGCSTSRSARRLGPCAHGFRPPADDSGRKPRTRSTRWRRTRREDREAAGREIAGRRSQAGRSQAGDR